jgi:tetratricopeptide (TPR) repeat protein
MWQINRTRRTPEYAFPAFLLLTALIGNPLAAPAQRVAENITEPPIAGPSVAVLAQTPTPEQIGDALLVQKRYQEAIEQYKKNPGNSAVVWNKMGIAYQMLFDLKDAERCYQQSLRLKPNMPRVLNNLGTIYDSMKEYRKAERLYRKALKLSPGSALITKNLGTNLLARHKYDQGWKMYQRALALNKNVFDGVGAPVSKTAMPREQRGAMNYYKAKSCVQQGMTERAIEYLRLALDQGFASPAKVAQDASFAGLHSNPAFEQMLVEQQEQYKSR